MSDWVRNDWIGGWMREKKKKKERTQPNIVIYFLNSN